jgi:hypothetical protein
LDYFKEDVGNDGLGGIFRFFEKSESIDSGKVDLNQVLILVSLLDIVVVSLKSFLVDELYYAKTLNILIVKLGSECI